MRLTWLGHASLKLETGTHVIYIDPATGLDESYTPATLVLVSSFDSDHCSLAKIRRITTDATQVIGTASVAREIYPCTVLLAHEVWKFNDVEIVGMPLVKGITQTSELGFVIVAENKTVYYMGDSDYFPSLENMQPDVLLINVHGTSIISAKKTAEIVFKIAPKLTIPIHFGAISGTEDDALLFSEFVKSPIQVPCVGEKIEL